MATLKDIRKRIQSVKNTRQITRAMKMVAAAKLRRAQDAIINSRAYAYRIYAILLSLVQREGMEHPLLAVRPEKKIMVVILSGDRGLCGAFNTSVFKAAARFLKQKKAEGVEVVVECIGRKGYDFFKNKIPVAKYHEGILGKANYNKVSAIADVVLADYLTGELDAVYLVYNEFKSAIQQTVTTERLIPVSTEVPQGVAGILRNSEEDRFKNYIFEPTKEEILNTIVPRHFKTQLFRAVLESVASEHGARMSAMENATNNASDMIDALTLEYNKARQASITKELMEIVGGVEAMR
jgi:F-type H+-transporting ATPase subunit gamma